MPNWNSNSLTIKATAQELIDKWWLIKPSNKTNDATLYRFNLHKLFPEKYPEEYKEWEFKSEEHEWCWSWTVYNTFDKYWDYWWCVENIWTKWLFEMYDDNNNEWEFNSCFETARWPPNLLLDRFYELSWIDLENYYEEPWMCFEWTLTCQSWDCIDNEQKYRPYCETCDTKVEETFWCESEWYDICKACATKEWLEIEE